MPSEKILLSKKQLVKDLNERIEGAVAGVIVDYKGITVEKDTRLRSELRGVGVKYAIVKNTMLNLAIKGTKYEGLSQYLKDSTALATSTDDSIVAAKILQKFSDESKGPFTIKAGFMDGKIMSADEVSTVAKLPNREQLLSMLCGALTGNIRGLALSLSRIAEQKETA